MTLTAVAPRRNLVLAAPTTMRVATRDRLAGGSHVMSSMGPVVMPPREAVVDALLRIVALGPAVRVGLLPTADGRSWRWDPDDLRARCEAMVTPLDLGPDVQETVDALVAQVDPTMPVRLFTTPDRLLLVADHALIDARVALGLPSAVLTVAAGGELPDWVHEATLRRPVLTAVTETFLRRPATLRSFLAARLRRAADADGVAAEHAAATRVVPTRAPAGGHAPLAVTPVDPASWRPDTTVVWRAGDRDGYRALRTWIRQSDRSLSFGAVLLAMLRATLADEGVPVADTADMVFDVRRWLPEHGQTNGNLITAIPIGGGTDPVAVQTELAGLLATGRPVAALAAGIVKAVVRASRPQAGTGGTPTGRPRRTRTDQPPRTPAARIALSNIGLSRALEALPWVDGAVARATLLVHPVASDLVSVQIVLLRGVVQMTATFNGNVLDRAAVERAVARVVEHPTAVLAAMGADGDRTAEPTTGGRTPRGRA